MPALFATFAVFSMMSPFGGGGIEPTAPPSGSLTCDSTVVTCDNTTHTADES